MDTSNINIEESKELNEFAIDAAELGIFDINLQTKQVFMNDRARGWTGLPVDQPVNAFKDLFHLITANDRERVTETFQALSKDPDEAKFHLEFSIVHPVTGKERILRTVGKIYWDVQHKAFRINGAARDISKEILNKQILEQKESNFRNIIMQAPVAMLILHGSEYIVETANPPALALIGKSAEEVIGKPLFEGLPEAKGQDIEALLDGVYTTGIPYIANEHPVRLPRNGKTETTYISFIYEALRDAEENISGIMSVGIDVTEAVLARKKITEADERARMAIEASELGTFDLDMKTWKVVCSKRFNEIFGLEDSVPYYEYIAMVHPEDMKIRDTARRNQQRLRHLHYEIRIIRKDKEVRWVRFDGEIFFDDDNNNPLRMIGTIKDITEKKSAEESIRVSEERFRLLADNIPQMIWTADPQGNLYYFSRSVYDYSGMKEEELYNNGWLKAVHPDDLTENIQLWNHSIATGEPYHFEVRLANSEGGYRWFLSRAVPQKDAQGNIQMWVGTSTDIQAQKAFAQALEMEVKKRTAQLAKSARELKRSNETLEKTNDELAKFAYVASHDMQEPLRKIQTFTSMILQNKDNIFSEGGKKYFDRIIASASHMQQLISDLLTYSRTNTPSKHFERTDLNELFKTIRHQMHESIVHKKAKIKSDVLPVANVIPFQVEQLFNNLLHNSLKFSKEGLSPEIKVRYKKIMGDAHLFTGINPQMEYHHISFADNGIGFEPQFNDRIFEVFRRLHSRDEYAGTGIGLSIIKKIMENHEGMVTAQGEPGKGATFHIYFPAQE